MKRLTHLGSLCLSIVLLGCQSVPTLTNGGPSDTSDTSIGGGPDHTTTNGTGESDIDPTTGSTTDTGSTDSTGDTDTSSDLPDPICDNGILEIGELCDDGDEKGVGCSDDCTEIDPNYLCLEEGKACVRVVTCGNGVIEGTEACDDGNTKKDDGCSAKCDKVDDGWACVKPGEACVEAPVCGNGTRERGEQCDDGQDPPEAGDGCDADCQLEDETGLDWECPPTGVCVAVDCGDGIRARTEQCDDGGNDDDDGCSSTCEVESGFRCSVSGCRAICGDGQILGDEECDDGNPSSFVAPKSGDGCSSSCSEESNWNCSGEPSVCVSTIICGNGVVDAGEVCDPGGRDGAPVNSGQADCYSWTSSKPCGGFASVIPEPHCHNNILEPGEACDGGSACLDNCTAVKPGWQCKAANYCIETPLCGDGKIQKGEECDSGPYSIAGCGQPGSNNQCKIVSGYFCLGEPTDCVLPQCGDGKREGAEQCDYDKVITGTAVANDGCDADCQLESGWACPPGKACQPICGDNKVKGNEQCDDGGLNNGDGCSSACQIEPKYDCGINGDQTCVLTKCPSTVGVATVPEHGEGCDDGNTIAGDGCGPTCQLEPAVTHGSSPSVTTTCGDGILITTGSSAAACSDGNANNNAGCAEACDDGNKNNGDGCSSECRIETGWSCADDTKLPGNVKLKIKYRDFKDNNQSGGHPHMRNNMWSGANSTTYNSLFPTSEDYGITGRLCTATGTTNGVTGVCGRLDDPDGKPVLDISVTNATIYGQATDATTAKAAFALWYQDSNINGATNTNPIGTAATTPVTIFPIPGNSFLTLGQSGANTSPKYVFDSGDNLFYPLDNAGDIADTTPGNGRGEGTGSGLGYGSYTNTGATHNWNFTSEIRYFFKYQRGQELQFYGDDDVWVYVNGRLAVDIGGIHGQVNRRVVLGDENASCDITSTGTCTLDAGELTTTVDRRFNITVGNLYEIVIFQAERNPTGSNYKLTLDGFLTPRSTCATTCGDERTGGPETCDEGFGSGNTGGDVNRNNQYGACRTNCSYAFCGDGVDDNQLALDTKDPEACDNGANIDLYASGYKTLASVTNADLCAPGCGIPAYCGDGYIDFAYGEECDAGEGLNTGSYGGCTSDCKLAPYCGDGKKADGSETCDCGPGSTNATCPNGAFEFYADNANGCGFDCKPAGYCGDNIRNGDENCDGTDVTGLRVCNSACDYAAVCGDGIKNVGEACDFGSNNAAQNTVPKYEGCSFTCQLGPHCGDMTANTGDGEECDFGMTENTGTYDGCTDACLLGPHCGDAVLQSQGGEVCDNGFNEDDYALPGNTDACGPHCKAVPYCGDKVLQSAYEFCDEGSKNNDTTYNGCTTTCEYGPYCGDGHLDKPDEKCDDGKDNVAYSPDGAACGYDCKPSPYCGDATRNGPEQCDAGTKNNKGEYNGCKSDCTRAPFCGDGKVQKSNGEQCDDGINGSLSCTNKCATREQVIH